MCTVAAVVDYLDQFAPSGLAADWDNVGLLLGERSASVERIMTCLTVTPESAAEAVEARANLIVTHHPILFRGVKRLTDAAPEGRMLLNLIRAGVAVHSPHTAFDNTHGGINDLLARRLDLRAVDALRPLPRGTGADQVKLVVFVPEKDLNRVAEALFAAGAGHIGEYRQCSFRLAGIGTFFGGDAANPTIGQKGRREEVPEWRLEAVCPIDRTEQVVAALRRAHSYEEPAFDIYPLQAAPARVEGEGWRVEGEARLNPPPSTLHPPPARGEGRLGSLEPVRSLTELAAVVKSVLHAGPVQMIGDPRRLVQRVAIVCGAGGEMLADAVRARADVLLTGEMRFHDYLQARAQGLALILPGHYATERCGVEELADRLRTQFPPLHVWASTREADPVQWM